MNTFARSSYISIKDIAKAAGVSHATVSRALQSSSLVKPETAQRIREIAQRFGYRPNFVGRSLATQRTQTIGVVVNAIADPIVAEMVSGVEAVARAHDYSVYLANCHADPETEMRVVQSFHERRVDGILVAASRVGALYEPIAAQMRTPIILINNQHPSSYKYSVNINSIPGSREAVGHLVALGHRDIAYIGDRFGYQTDLDRFSGYRQALELAGIAAREEWIVHGDGKLEGGTLAMRKLLDLPALPSAVFCYNDMTAIGALRVIHEHSLRVPQDISLAGFDDLFLASYTEPPLTTVRQPKHEMGRMATEILLRILAGEDSDARTEVKGELIVRASTAPPRA
ncbi:MAG: LacI family transcriptional regulator [Acidobacteriia bacterium]|nr:LacI family transcriptional regulator [Terriglobia bacterium]